MRASFIILSLALVSISFLFISPLLTDPNLIKYNHVVKVGRAVIYENGDTPLYIETARNPGHYFEKKFVRQNRPLYGFAAHLVGAPLDWLCKLFGVRPKLDSLEGSYLIYGSVLVFFNFIFVFLAAFLFSSIFLLDGDSRSRSSVSILALSTTLIRVFPAFFWQKRRARKDMSLSKEEKKKIVEKRIFTSKTSGLFRKILAAERALGKFVNYPFGVRCVLTVQKVSGTPG